MTQAELRLFAQIMIKDLEDNMLSVVLIPAPEPKHADHMIRAVESRNPKWYRLFCADFISDRKGGHPRTYIKREHVFRALSQIASGKSDTIYAERLLPYIEYFYKTENKKYDHN